MWKKFSQIQVYHLLQNKKGEEMVGSVTKAKLMPQIQQNTVEIDFWSWVCSCFGLWLEKLLDTSTVCSARWVHSCSDLFVLTEDRAGSRFLLSLQVLHGFIKLFFLHLPKRQQHLLNILKTGLNAKYSHYVCRIPTMFLQILRMYKLNWNLLPCLSSFRRKKYCLFFPQYH